MPKRKDANELAKSLIDDIIAETESEDWDKPEKKSQKKSATDNPIQKKTKINNQPFAGGGKNNLN